MNSKKAQDALLPIIIVFMFTLISYVTATLMPVRTWSNILLLGSMELVCIYAIVIASFNKNRQRLMCLILSLQFLLYTTFYTLVTWVYTNFDAMDGVHDSFYQMYEPVSGVVCSLLLVVACWPESALNGFSTFARIDFYLGRINNRLGVYLFSVDKAKQ